MKHVAKTVLMLALVVSGCATPEPSVEHVSASENIPLQEQENSGISPDVAPPVATLPSLQNEAKPLRPSLLGATYIKRTFLPKVVANNWKVVAPLMLGKEGDSDVFVIEKKSRKRLVLATSEKRVLRNFYRYSIKSELELPRTTTSTLIVPCTSPAGAVPRNEIAMLDLSSGVKIIWLANKSKVALKTVAQMKDNHICEFMHAGTLQKQMLFW